MGAVIRWRPVLAALAMSALCGAASAEPMAKWDKDHKLAKPVQIGGLTLVGAMRPGDPDDEDKPPTSILTVTDSAGQKGRLTAEVAFGDVVYASYGVGRLDPLSSRPQVLLTTYTGGAHCCVHIQLLDWLKGGWRPIDVGTFDGSPFDTFPTDVDGDGAPDIVHYDDRFAYAFDSYAGSWMPPRIFNIRGGKVIDVSAEPRYRPLFAKNYERAKQMCLDGGNGACAGMVADAARLGRIDEAWPIALAHYDTSIDWGLPGCKIAALDVSKCPKDQRFKPTEIREALTQMLTRAGYITSKRPQG